MNYISIKHLKALEACEEQTQKFKEVFGSSIKFESLEEAQELAIKYAQEFNFEWFGGKVFGEVYEEARAPLWETYEEAEAPLWNAYQEAITPLWKTYQESEDPLWEAYQEVETPLRKTYLEAEAPIRKTYRENCAKVFAKMWWEIPEGTKDSSKGCIWHD